MEVQLLVDARAALLRLAAVICTALAAGPPDAAAVRMVNRVGFKTAQKQLILARGVSQSSSC